MVFFCSYLKCLEAEEQVKRNEFIARRFEQDVCQGILPPSGFHHQSTKPRATIMALDKTCHEFKHLAFELLFTSFMLSPSSSCFLVLRVLSFKCHM